jgi:hypothetical protein
MKHEMSLDAAQEAPTTARKPRRGPPITITCECGERRDLAYGERWQCEKCGRTWNTNRIPMEQYDQVRRVQLRLRWLMLGQCTVALVILLVFIAIGKWVGGVLLVAISTITWRMYVWPRQKRRYFEAIDKRPSWEIEPD